MTIIDQRILIPTAPEPVWAIISNLNDNPKWQADCQSISFLTSLRSGPGVRWRYTSPNSQEYVIEITAWYDGLGYEYTYVDGAPFRKSKGTIRLQEIAEGTVVQWTLNYETGGMLGGVRNALSIRRHYDRVMVDSLKALWTHLKETGRGRHAHEARSLMRDALDYEARAQYTPRHPSRVAEKGQAAPAPLVTEPPVSDEDTRPNPALTAEAPREEKLVESSELEPTPASDIARFQRPPQSETPPSPPIAAPAQPPAAPQPAPSADSSLEAAPVSDEQPAAPAPPVQKIEPVPAQPAVEQVEAQPAPMSPEPAAPEAEQPAIDAQPQSAETVDEFSPKVDTSKLDTREISIWEVFGLPKPSDTERMKAITDEQLAQADAAAALEKGIALPEPQVAAPESVIRQPQPPILSEDTRPHEVFQAPRQPAIAVLIPGFRMRARRRLVKLRRHY